MANITTTLVDNTIPTIVGAEILAYLKANTVMAQLVRRDWDTDVASYGETVSIPYGGTLSANSKSADSTITLQTPDDAVYQVSLDNHQEVSFLIEDIAAALARPDWLNYYAGTAMAVLAEDIDSKLTALYSGFSSSIDALSGLGEDDFREARRQLNSAKAPLAQRYAVLHEDAEYALLGIEKATNRDYVESLGSAAANPFTARFMGLDVLMDQQIAVASTEAKNLFFHRDAMVLAMRPLATAPAGMGVQQQVMSEDGMGLRVTMSYDHDYLGTKFTVDVLYGVAELRDNHGIVVRTTEI